MLKLFIHLKPRRLILCCLLLTLLISLSPQSAHGFPLGQDDPPIYIVQPQDTLNSIALRFGVAAEDIQSANGIADPNTLKIDQRLIIPGLDGISGLLTSQVLPFGTSLTSLSRQYQLDPAALITLNKLTSPSETIAGIKFLVAVAEDQTTMTSVTKMKPGQTALEVAIRQGGSPWTLASDNLVANTWQILPQEPLYAPTDADSPPPSVHPGIDSLSVEPLPLIQGETVLISVNTETDLTLSGSLDGKPLTFFSEDGAQYVSFHGIHALAETGPVSLQVTAKDTEGNQTTLEQLALLAPGDYGNEWVFVSEDYLDEEVIAAEDAYLAPILDRISPDRLWDGKFQYPVDDPCVNSLFGQRRDYNEGELFFYHTGLDFAVCAPNLNIYAPASGKVVLAEELTIKGNAVILDHGWGVFTAYAHLAEINVAVGDRVIPGDLLGLIGNTGRSAGPHLHFEVIISGNPVNPQTWLSQEFP